MRDDQTGTYWQQISGRAVAGPLAGSQLELVYSDELTFALWKQEAPQGTVLKPVMKYASEYETKDWEKRIGKAKTVLDFPGTGLQSRDVVLGVEITGASRAYPVDRVLAAKVVEDRLGGEPVLIVAGPDGKSLRVFHARGPGRAASAEFYRNIETGTGAGSFLDAATGSEWDFRGCAVAGKLSGTCLEPIPAVKDYWFDWRNYHPATTIFHR